MHNLRIVTTICSLILVAPLATTAQAASLQSYQAAIESSAAALHDAEEVRDLAVYQLMRSMGLDVNDKALRKSMIESAESDIRAKPDTACNAQFNADDAKAVTLEGLPLGPAYDFVTSTCKAYRLRTAQ